MFDENLQTLPYLGIVAVSDGSFLLYVPRVFHAFLEVAPIFKGILDRKPTAPIISTNLVKGYIMKGVQHKQ